jgi:uncharacterized membrane protein
MILRIVERYAVKSRVMKLLRYALLAITICASVIASANPKILEKLKEVYSKPTADCQFCHTTPPKKNDYGKVIEAALLKSGSSQITAQVFQSIETNDADGDGASNGEELKANTLPGDASSKPAATSTPVAKEAPASTELVPKHSLHPAIVHFPIALLAVAALLQLLALKKNDDLYHKASIINLAIGLICSAGAIVTGVAAWLRLGYSLEGNLLIHLILASISVLVGFGAYVQREKPSYLWLIVLSGVLVLVAGHFGGTMVYG